MIVDEVRDLIPLFALDALDEWEADSVAAHLGDCEACRRDLARHAAVAAELIPEERPVTEVWLRIVSEIEASTRPLAPPPPRLPRRLAWAAAAVAVASLGGVVVAQRQQLVQVGEERAVETAATVAATEPGAVAVELVADSTTVARVILTAAGEGFILPRGLEPLGDDRTYQLWVVTADRLVISAGVLGPDPEPSRFTWAGTVSGFALTREVAGGVVSSAGDVVAAAEL